MTKKKSSSNLVWMDLEMSGLDPEKDVILEVATIVTDAELNILAEGPVIAIHQGENVPYRKRARGPLPTFALLHRRRGSRDARFHKAFYRKDQERPVWEFHYAGQTLPI